MWPFWPLWPFHNKQLRISLFFPLLFLGQKVCGNNIEIKYSVVKIYKTMNDTVLHHVKLGIYELYDISICTVPCNQWNKTDDLMACDVLFVQSWPIYVYYFHRKVVIYGTLFWKDVIYGRHSGIYGKSLNVSLGVPTSVTFPFNIGSLDIITLF